MLAPSGEIAATPDPTGEALRALAALGVPPMETRLYLALLDEVQPTETALASRLAAPVGQVRASMHALAARGLLTELVGVPGGFAPVSPEIAVEDLVSRREERLRDARHRGRLLAARFAAANPGTSVATPAARGIGDLIEDICRTQARAHREILVLDEPTAVPAKDLIEARGQALARGVTVRVVYCPAALAQPGVLRSLRDPALAAQRSKIVPTLPGPMTIVDGRTVIRPAGPAGEHGSVALSSPSLTTACVALFETIWQQAVPVPEAMRHASVPAGSVEAIAAMLSCGLEDDDIARELNLSRRTVRRRLAELMNHLGARTRYQAGYRYALTAGR